MMLDVLGRTTGTDVGEDGGIVEGRATYLMLDFGRREDRPKSDDGDGRRSVYVSLAK